MNNPTETNPLAEPSREQKSDAPNENQTISFNKSQLVNLCAVGLIICFFLPWISILFGKPSGLDFAKEGAKATEGAGRAFVLFWAIPFFNVVTVLAGLAKQSQKNIGRFTGALPFAVLAYGMYHVGGDIMRILDFGGYLSLILGLVLFILSRGVK